MSEINNEEYPVTENLLEYDLEPIEWDFSTDDWYEYCY